MTDGSIREIGSHEELMARKGLYCAMYESGFSMLVFLVFVIAMDVITIRLVRGKSASDEPV